VSVYSYRLDDLIEQVDTGDGVYRYENVSQARAHGIDLDAEGREPGGWQWRSSLSLSELSTRGAVAVNSPRWLTKGHVVKTIGEDWSLGGQWFAMASREGLRQKVRPLLTVDAVIRRQVAPGHSLALVVRNLLDRDNHDPASSDNDLLRIPLPGRSVTLEWRGQF
jgi:outer membrane receptor protein involved in Fe transport